MNFGFWGTVAPPAGAADGYYNRLIEDKVSALGGQKGLYSTSFYAEDDFWAHYNGPEYARLKRDYDGEAGCSRLYDKCVGRR